jgi:choline dehydrogenase
MGRRSDFIVIGTGTAGAVVANILSSRGNSVIALEAGSNDTQEEHIKDSLFAGIEFGLEQNFNSGCLWQLIPLNNGSLRAETECVPGDNVSIHCSCVEVPGFPSGIGSEEKTNHGIYTTGRTLGGGSSINGQQWVLGTPAVYSEWEQASGSSLWSRQNVLKAFNEISRYYNPNGFVDIRQTPLEPTSMANKFVTAITTALGISYVEDYNKELLGAFTKWQLTQQPNTNRSSSSTSFLGPDVIDSNGNGVNGRCLNVLTNTTALRLIWKRNRAIGVEILSNGVFHKIYSRCGIIVSAGVFTPSFLQGSGIGPKSLLDCLNISTVFDNPNVGQHWSNHTLITAVFSANMEDNGTPLSDPAALYTGGAFLAPLLPEDDVNRRGYQLIGASPKPGIFLIIILYLQPHSKGLLRIQSSDPLTPPLVDNRYMIDPLDVEAYVAALQKYIKPIANHLHKIDPAYQLISPDPSIIDNNDKLKEFVLGSFDHSHHWQGSCRMGRSSDDSVVDGEGKVFGVKGLYVADDSIAPIMNDGNTQAPAYLIGWQVAHNLLRKVK